MSLGMKNFFDNLIEPVSVSLTDKFSDALDKMLENDFSQLPVIDNDNRPIGFVTYQNIARALIYLEIPLEELFVSDVFEEITSTQIFRSDDELSTMLDRLRDTNAILIVNANKELIGIVTTYDSTEYFRTRSEDLLNVQDIEAKIKEILMYFFQQQEFDPDNDDLRKAIEKVTNMNPVSKRDFSKALRDYLAFSGEASLNQNSMETVYTKYFTNDDDVKPFSDLTLYDYIALLIHQDQQSLFEELFGYSSDRIQKLLDNVRKTRNDLAHLKEISPIQRDQIIQCKKLLERIQIGIPVDWPKSNQEIAVKNIREDAANYDVDHDGLVATALRDLGGEIVDIISEETDPRESRYTPLADWLQSQRGNNDKVKLTFEKIEEIIGGELPSSAYNHRAWWANDSVEHTHSKLWLEVGWRRSYLNMSGKYVTFVRIKEREKAYINFFNELVSKTRDKADFLQEDISPNGTNWLICQSVLPAGPSVAQFIYSFARGKRFRVELYIATGEKETSKEIFDKIFAYKDTLTKEVGEITWERIDNKTASRIALYHPGSITDDTRTLKNIQDWAVEKMISFYNVFEPIASQAVKEVLNA